MANNIFLPGTIHSSQVDGFSELIEELQSDINDTNQDVYDLGVQVSQISNTTKATQTAEQSKQFKWCPDSSQIGTSEYNDTPVIYITPSEIAGEFNIYSYISSSWVLQGTHSLNISIDSSDISYGNDSTVYDEISKLDKQINGGEEWYWADMYMEKRGITVALTNNWYLARSTSGTTYAGNAVSGGNYYTIFVDVNAGETYKISGVYWYILYNATADEMGVVQGMSQQANYMTYGDTVTWTDRLTSLRNYYVSSYPETGNLTTTEYEFTIPVGVKCIGISFSYNSGTASVQKMLGVDSHLYKWTKKSTPNLIDGKYMKIDDWEDSCIPFCNNSLASLGNLYYYHNPSNNLVYNIGDRMMPLVRDDIAYSLGGATQNGKTLYYRHRSCGSRTIRLEVKSGEILKLDISSAIRYSLIFTDYDYIITELLDQRRFKGYYTVPNDGYVYICDTLYKDNYKYDNIYGKLIQQSDESNKSCNKVYKEWSNEYNIDKFEWCDVGTRTGAATLNYYLNLIHNADNNKYVLSMARVSLGPNNTQNTGTLRMVGERSVIEVTYNSVYINTLTGNYKWIYIIVQDNSYASANILVRGQNLTTNLNLHLIVDKVYQCHFDTAEEAYMVATDFINGKLSMDEKCNIYQEYDILASSVGLSTIDSLGYNIVEKGAELPLNSEGISYGISLKNTAGKQFGAASDNGTADTDLVYLPVMDWSNYTGTKAHMFHYCRNLETIPDIEWSSNLTISVQSFRHCEKLKQVGNLTPALCSSYGVFENCYRLESVGNINCSPADSTNGLNNMFKNCYSLKRIGELSNTGNAGKFANTFNNCYSLKCIPNLDCSSATTLEGMCRNCYNITEFPNLTDTSNVTNMAYMFCRCKLLKSYNMNYDTSSVTNMQSLFYGCENIKDITIDCTSAENMTYLAFGTSNLDTLTLKNIGQNASSVSMAQYINSSAVKTLIYDNCDFTKVTNLNDAVQRATNLIELPEMNTTSCTTMNECFYFSSKLKKIALLDWSSITTAPSTSFLQGTSIRYLKIQNWGKSSLTTYNTFSSSYGSTWGSTDDVDYPDALDSLKWTFNNLYDRTSNSMGTCTINLYSILYDRLQGALTSAEWTAMENKGYNIVRQ